MATGENKPPRRLQTGVQPQGPRRGARPQSIPPRTSSQQARPAATGSQPTRSGQQRTGPQRTGPQRTSTQRTTTSTQRLSRRIETVRPRWQRILRKTLAWGATVGLVATTIGFVGLAILYQRIEVPTPSDFAQAQASTFYYADGVTPIGSLGVRNREIVALADLPEYVGAAIVAAEDRSFYTNPGIDIVGTARALYRTVVQGKKQGGSTITQQYVERYYVGETTTDIPGKIEEALLALKIDQQEDKPKILENYMNTIYFGRGAYGIQAAAREYFDKDAAQLTISEAAMLAGILPAPSAWDPRLNLEQATFRWNYVLDGLVAADEISAADRLKLDFPVVSDYRNDNVYGGPNGYIIRAALEEVSREWGLSIEEVESRGFRIVTTIDAPTQAAAVQAASEIPDDHSPNLRVAIVTMNPETGAITSMYGGADYLEIQRNAVTQDVAQAGSTFKPFALVAALEDGWALESEFNGNSGVRVDGFTNPVRNFRGVSYGQINLIDATANSVNAVYAQLTHDVGPERIVETAVKAGLPEGTLGLEANPANVLGTASPHPLDMASAYATFAAAGFSTKPFLVQTVIFADGERTLEHVVEREQVFSYAVMAETTYAMQQVVNRGSGVYASRLGRPIAGKTGTSNDDRSAWFIGFTPQIVGAVALYQVGEDGSAESITPFGGFREITGGTIPVRVWTWMMEDVLADMPVVAFPARTYIGDAVIPTPSPSASPSPSPSPTEEPSPTPSTAPEPGPSLPPVLPSPSASGGLLGGLGP